MLVGAPAQSPGYVAGPCRVVVCISWASFGGRAWLSGACGAAFSRLAEFRDYTKYSC